MLTELRPNLSDLIRLNGKWRASETAVIAPDGELTWREFDIRVDQVARGLIEAGLEAGDRLGMLASSRLATLEMMWGAIRAGMVVVPLNPAVTDEAVRQMLDDAGVAGLYVTDDFAPRLADYPNVDPSRRWAAAAGDAPAPAGWIRTSGWRDLPAEPVQQPQDPSAACNIIYSSGTTGLPKGIVQTMGGRTAWARELVLALRYHRQARSLVCTGLYSNITWAAMLSIIATGGVLVLHDGFDASRVLEHVEAGGITHLSLVPVLCQRLLEHPDFRADRLRSVQSIMSVGAPLPLPVKSRLISELPGRLIELWGLTEGLLSVLDPEVASDHRESVGKPVSGCELKLLGPDDQEVSPGEAGEIVGRSCFLMTGYWRRPEATREVTWYDADGAGWLRTGDIGRLDAEGYLSIVDRKKDMILSGGQNIYPADIEAILVEHPKVLECAVIGVPSERWGETPLAVVVPRGAELDASELLEWLNARLGRQQRVAAVAFSQALPRNPAGKVLKRELRTSHGSTTS